MEKEKIIQELEEEKAQCLARINRIEAAIEHINMIDGQAEPVKVRNYTKKKLGTKKKYKTKKCGTKKEKSNGTRRPRLTGEALEAKKRECVQLLKEGKLSKGEIAEKLDVHPSVIYYWAGYRKPGQDKKKASSNSVKKSHKKKCENCHDADATCFYEGQQVCNKCFKFFKTGKAINEESDPEDDDISDVLED
jgi:transposase-like protein